MHCHTCSNQMILVGREIKPGHSEIWADGWVCPVVKCGYGMTDYRGGETAWPAMTLTPEVPLQAMIRGAMKFRDAVR